MWYLVYAEDYSGSLEGRRKARPAHLARLSALASEGRLILAGPNPAVDSENPGDAGFTGSTVIAKFDSLEEAKKWADADPYVEAHVFKNLTVKPLLITAKPSCAFF